jgi:ribosomal protein S18 acetylase RimI-like enzyme
MPDIVLRPIRPDDVAPLVQLTASTSVFRPDEVEIAREALSRSAEDASPEPEYITRVASEGDALLGYVTFGPTPLTSGTWDVHWIAVDPAQQRRGTGRRLMTHVEEEACRKGGRQVLAETSALYAAARHLFLSQGYRDIGSIPDFYDIGVSRVTYAKTLDCGRRAPG